MPVVWRPNGVTVSSILSLTAAAVFQLFRCIVLGIGFSGALLLGLFEMHNGGWTSYMGHIDGS